MKALGTKHAADADTLERLARFDTHGQPVLSRYIDLEPSQLPTPDRQASQLGALLDAAGGRTQPKRRIASRHGSAATPRSRAAPADRRSSPRSAATYSRRCL